MAAYGSATTGIDVSPQDGGVTCLSLTVVAPNGTAVGPTTNSCQASSSVQVGLTSVAGQLPVATGSGTYSVWARGTFYMNLDVTDGDTAQDGADSVAFDTWSPPAPCAGLQPPAITSVMVNGYPSASLAAGTSGTIWIGGACLDASQVSVSGGAVSTPPGSATIYYDGAQYDIAQQFTVAANATPGDQTLTVTGPTGLTDNTGVEITPSAAPYIDGVYPSVWPAGTTSQVTITGSGFGCSPTTTTQPCQNGVLQISQAGSYVAFSVTSWTDTAIMGTATVSAGEPGETLSLSIAGTGYGLGFVQAASQGAGSNAAAVQAPGASNTVKLVVSLGSPSSADPWPSYCPQTAGPVALGGVVCISSAPAFPQLAAQLTGPSGQALSGQVDWKLTSHDVNSYNSTGKDANGDSITVVNTVDIICGAPELGADTFLDASIPWNIGSNLAYLCGGNATLEYKYGQTSGSFPFQILGQNPNYTAVESQLSAYPWFAANGGTPWFLYQLVNQESSYQQFNNTGAKAGLPNYGAPQGFGLMQVDPPRSPATLYDWKQAAADGLAILQGFYAGPYWKNQTDAWNLYNVDNPQNPASPPRDDSEGNCTFSYAPASSEHSYSDAVWIKRYNSGRASKNFSFNNFITFSAPAWIINPLAPNGTNYVLAVCNRNQPPN